MRKSTRFVEASGDIGVWCFYVPKSFLGLAMQDLEVKWPERAHSIQSTPFRSALISCFTTNTLTVFLPQPMVVYPCGTKAFSKHEF